jgi:hypothetical protein
MESPSGGGTPSASAAFIKGNVSLHGAGLSEKGRAAVIRVLGEIEPVDEDDLSLFSEEDFALFVRSGLGASCVLPAMASH